MVLVSVQSIEDGNGYSFKNDFAESLIIDPNSRISLVNIQFDRKVDYLVLNTGNAFEVKVGAPTSEKDIIGILAGSYNVHTLAEAIQTSLNNVYHPSGHTFSVEVGTDGKFQISNSYQTRPLAQTRCVDWDVTTNAEVGAIRDHSGSIHFGASPAPHLFTGITQGTSNYVQCSASLETTYVPNLADGGTSAEFNLAFTKAVYPQTPTTEVTLGFVVALAEGLSATLAPGGAVGRQVTRNDELGWVKTGIAFFADVNGNPHVKFIEDGQDIGPDIRFVPRTGDYYRILLASDIDFPLYQYKRSGQTEWTSWDLNFAAQRFSNWTAMDLMPVLAGDCADLTSGNGSPILNTTITPKGGGSLLPQKLVGVSRNGTHSYSEDSGNNHTGTLTRETAGASATGNNTGDGMLFQLLNADDYADFEFKMRDNQGDFYVSIVDEDKRLVTQTAQADANSNGTDILGGLPWGMTADVGGAQTTAQQFNPCVFSYRFNGWTGCPVPPIVPYGTGKIYKRRNFNAGDSAVGGRIIPGFEEVVGYDWSANDTSLFIVRVEGSANKVQLWVSAKGDKTDLVLLDESVACPTDFRGALAVNNIVNNTAFTANINGGLFRLGSSAQGGIVVGNTDGNGDLTAITSIQVSGNSYTAGAPVLLTAINPATGDADGDTGVAQVTIQTLVTTNHTGNMGVKFDSTKTTNGYRFFAGFANAETSKVTDVQLNTTKAQSGNSYFEFYPRYEADFGEMLGFARTKYIIQSGAYVVSDNKPVPQQQVNTDPTLIVNVDNLPHKSYIGMGTPADSLIGYTPVGNVQGMTKMIGKVPRHINDNGSGGGGAEGPFYYDYFPYSIPLRNATEIVMNEIDVTIRNSNGTLATDVLNVHMLMDITNVEGAGEAVNQGSIGKPLEAPMNYDRLNVPKAQLMPSIRGGFAQGEGNMNDQPTRHNMADKHNELNPMSHL